MNEKPLRLSCLFGSREFTLSLQLVLSRVHLFVYLRSKFPGVGLFMKRIAFIALIFVLHTAASAQTGNEWINYSVPYYKIPVGKDGIHRLTRTQLVAAGIPSFVDPKTLKIFHRGVEQAIYVEGEGDNQLNTNDFVEFFGRRNDGTLDAQLFATPAAQPHKLYNLYSDTTAYFLTYGGASGKRANATAQTTQNPAEQFHWDERLIIYSGQYSPGVEYNSGEVQLSAFENGEGWTSPQILHGSSADFAVGGITNSVPSAGLPKIELLLTGRGAFTHEVEISVGSRVLGTITINEFNSFKYESDLQWSDISGSGQLIAKIKVNGVSGRPARVSLGYIKIIYPQAFTFGGSNEKYFVLNENSQGISAVKIQSAPGGSVVYDVTDPNNVIRIPVSISSTLDMVVGQTTAKRKLFAANTVIVPAIKRITFRQINPAAQDYVIITHSSLRKPIAGYTDPVKALGEYRALPQGGSFDTLIVNVDQLYNQFSYGETTPVAIYNFLKYLKTGKLPDYLFLVGKGLDVNYGYYRDPASFPQFKDLVPTAGLPASDMKFSAGLSGIAHVPGIATGRLSAAGPADVAAYLNKLKEFESQPFDNLRRKSLLHLSGGLYDNEPQLFRSYLEGFANVAESYGLGGNVKAIAKQSTNIEVINVADEVNKGLNLITLFGHSSPSSGDFDIGLVTDPLMGYNNKGKYPALLLNGCLAGSYFLNASIFGENWTNSPDRGAIGIIAHSSYGYAPFLRTYSDFFYNVAYGDSVFINKGIGDVQKEIAKRYLAVFPNSVIAQSQVQQMVYLGDPAVSLFGAPKPDYAIVPNSVLMTSTDGSRVSAFSDSLALQFTVNNYGQAKDKSMRIRITRTLNDNSTVSYDTLVKATLFSDTITVTVPGRIDHGFGNNNFSISIDSDDSIDELNEENNLFEQVFFIPLSGTKNLYPDEFAIVNSQTPTLSFQHTDQLSAERDFVLQVDTTKDFNSGFLKTFPIKAKVLALQKIDLLEKDSLVYYWRTKLKEPQTHENINWEVSSFTYINNGPTGWTQRQYGQFENNVTQGLEKDSQSKKIEFEETVTKLDVLAYGADRSEFSGVKINGAEYNLYNEANNFHCRDNTINIIAFDKTTTQPYAGLYFTWIELRDLFGGAALLCGREPYVINSFLASEVNQGQGGDLIQYISNIPMGDSVLLFTIGDAGIATWPSEVKLKMNELGVSVTQLDQLQAGEPVVIFARKGAMAGSATLYRTSETPVTDQTVAVQRNITGRKTEGTMTSTLIGPALAWHDFLLKYSVDNSDDVVSVTVYGVGLSGKSTVLFQDVHENISLSSINADTYPYLKISINTKDPTFVTAAELSRWMVTFDPAPEGLLLFDGEQKQNVVAEGQSWPGSYSFINISDRAFKDSLSVDYKITRSGSTMSTSKQMLVQAPAPGDTTQFTLSFPSIGHAGMNDLYVNVNPRIQPENDFDNNFVTLVEQLKVLKDTLSPLLEVTFDGRFIAQHEFVSPQPDIRIVLFDNNPFLLNSDTTRLKLFIQQPCEEGDECVFKPIYFSSPELTFQSETPTSELEVHYRPTLALDGVYTLRVVASDASGNFSGSAPFEIAFSVSHANTVALSSPYPNPFHDRTSFEINVAGEAVPYDASLILFNSRGAVVREFGNESFQQLHFGKNIFTWEGLDENGIPVPNGMYIYKLLVKSEDGITEKIGKLVLVR